MSGLLEFLNQPVRLDWWSLAFFVVWFVVIGPVIGVWVANQMNGPAAEKRRAQRREGGAR